jgi:hypothetical protein
LRTESADIFLDIWVGEAHDTPQGNYLVMNLDSEIKFQNFITESVVADVNDRPSKNPKNIPIYLKAGYAFGFSFSSGLIFVIVWSAPTRTSVLPVKLPLLRILSYSALSRQYKANQRALDIWVGEAHGTPRGNYLVMNLDSEMMMAVLP